MPPENRFRHQAYTAERPTAPYHSLCAVPPPAAESAEGRAAERAILRHAGRRWRANNVAAVYLLHGTFTGADALGLAGELAMWLPTVAQKVRDTIKGLVDHYLGDAANYSDRFAAQLQEAIVEENQPLLPIRRLLWSSENLHIGRADCAIRLLDELASHDWPPESRILVWAHSHAGNALALATNLLADDDVVGFFRLTRPYYRTALKVREGLDHWSRVESHLASPESPLRRLKLDIVTFGTPIRYGWDCSACGRLLHVVHHRAAEGLPEWRAPPPKARETDDDSHTGGDLIHQLGIAGTNFTPPPAAVRVWRIEARLRRLLEWGLRRRDLPRRLKCGQRVAADGTTLLVDYGPGSDALAGHAVYTRESWLPFHADLVTRWLYEPPAGEQDIS